jgi:N-acetylneuraminic acid mutarotase
MSSFEVFDDMWAYDSARNIWEEIVPNNKPSARSGQSMVYDSYNRKTILFGGWNEDIGLTKDTWVYDSQSNQWINKSTTISPDIRQSHAMCYHPIYHRVILFGGYRDIGPHFNDTWIYDYTSNMWTELHPANSPSGRYGARMVYDPINQRIFLFGGRSTSILDDTWVYYYENNTWTEINTTGHRGIRYWHGMVYDSHNHKIIVFGGRRDGAPGSALEDTKIFDPSTNEWTEPFPTPHPSNRMEPLMVYDSSTHKAVLFGGYRFSGITLGDTWTYTYSSNSWSLKKGTDIR